MTNHIIGTIEIQLERMSLNNYYLLHRFVPGAHMEHVGDERSSLRAGYNDAEVPAAAADNVDEVSVTPELMITPLDLNWHLSHFVCENTNSSILIHFIIHLDA